MVGPWAWQSWAYEWEPRVPGDYVFLEVRDNPRSRSAVMRVAERTEVAA